jgi:hypothetical protein
VASKLVAVHRHAKTATVEGGVVIEIASPTTAAEWCDYYGVSVVDGVATLYKSVRADYGSSHDPGFSWRPGTQPDAGGIDDRECGVGLHFSPCVSMARQFYEAPDARYLACPVRVEDIRVQANAAFHAEAMHYAAAKGHLGDAAVRFVAMFKDDLLGLLWGYRVHQNQYTGEVLTTLVEPHTADLTVAQFSELQEMAMVKAAEDGYVWRAPDEYREAKEAAEKRKQRERVRHDEAAAREVTA